MQSFDVFFDLHLNKRWVNNGEAGDLRCHLAHYDVTVMQKKNLPSMLIIFYHSRNNLLIFAGGETTFDPDTLVKIKIILERNSTGEMVMESWIK